MATRIRHIDIYTVHDEFDAELIEFLLEDCNISCCIRTLKPLKKERSSQPPAEKRIAVETAKVESAKRIITEALKSGALSAEGRFVF